MFVKEERKYNKCEKYNLFYKKMTLISRNPSSLGVLF